MHDIKTIIGENNLNHVIKGAMRDLPMLLLKLSEEISLVIYE